MTALTSGSIAQLLGAELVGPADLPIGGIESLERAGPGMLTFIRDRQYAAGWPASRAAAAVVTRGFDVPGHDPSKRALLVVPNADASMVKVLAAFAPPAERPPPGVHPSAIVDPTAKLGAGVTVGPMCLVGPNAVVGDGTVLVARVTLGRDVRVGRVCTLHPGVVIQDRCAIGDQCLLHPGVVIGADGFGFVPAPDGRGLAKIPHIGTVQVGDGVEIGANSCIDRAKFGATVIGSGTKIDNLVQIGHGVKIGRACLVCGQVGIGGSAEIGDGVVLAGQVGVADNIRIGNRAQVGAKSGAPFDVPDGAVTLWYPPMEPREALRTWSLLPKLADLFGRVRKLERSRADEHAPAAERAE